MDADRPDLFDYKRKTKNSETIGGGVNGNGHVAQSDVNAYKVANNSQQQQQQQHQPIDGDQSWIAIDQQNKQHAADTTNLLSANNVLSGIVADVAVVGVVGVANANDDKNEKINSSVCNESCDGMIEQKSIIGSIGVVASDTNSVLPSANVPTTIAATETALLLSNQLNQNNCVNRVSANDDDHDNVDNGHTNILRDSHDDDAQTNNDLHAQQESLSSKHDDSVAPTAIGPQPIENMYQRIPSDDDAIGDNNGTSNSHRTNGFVRQTNRRSPSQRKKKRMPNGTVYNSLTHLNDDDDDDHDVSTSKPNSKDALYNEYVNLLCDTNIGARAANKETVQRSANQSNVHAATEANPLLLDLSSRKYQKPPIKGIVKSPSTQTFNGAEKCLDEAVRKPRFSIQCNNTDSERPVLHVQFLPNQSKTVTGLSQSYPARSSLSPSSDMVDNGNYQTNSHTNGRNGNGGTFSARSSISSTDSSTVSSPTDDSSSESSSSDEDSTIGQIAEAKPPDGGWGWVVVFASFMVNLIADGITFSFGVIYVEFLNYFGEG